MAWSSYALGLGFLGIVVILWVTTGVITQSIFVDLNLDAPFFLTYCNNLIFVGYLVPDLWRRKTETQYTEIGEVDDWRSRVRLASVFCPVWFAMSYLYNASLAHTSVASNTIMSSTSSFFTFLLGIAILRQSFSYVSLMGVICTIAGAVLVVLPDSKQSQERNTTIGDILALSSAALYGLYTVLLKKFVGDERKLAMRKFLGTIGVINSISLILPVFLLSHFKVEDLSPLSWKIALGLLVNGLFNMASDLLWAKAILLTSPLLASIALTVSVPLAVMADCILRGKRFGLEYLGGSALVLIGFFLVNYHDNATNAAEEEISTSIDATPREILTGSDSPDVADGFNDVGH